MLVRSFARKKIFHSTSTMSSIGGRFNLRTRKSLILVGQIECSLCKRHYFPLENSDDDDIDDQKENICCNCEEKQQYQPPTKKRAIQCDNDAKATAIKRERMESNSNISNQNSQTQPDANQTKVKQPKQRKNTQNRKQSINSKRIVQTQAAVCLTPKPAAFSKSITLLC